MNKAATNSFIQPHFFRKPPNHYLSPRCAYPTGGKSPLTIRIFLDTTLVPGTRHPLPPAERSHLRARRLQPGTNITLFNGDGARATGLLHEDASVTILSQTRTTSSTTRKVSAIIGMPKSPQRVDWAVEKLTELGACRVSFCDCARAVAKAPGEGKVGRWRRIAVAAVKQCLRHDVPEVGYVGEFGDVIAIVENADLAVLLSAHGKPLLGEDFLNSVSAVGDVVVVAGPEGGFTKDEENAFIRAGAKRIALGENRLRVETAIVSAVAVITQIGFRELKDGPNSVYMSDDGEANSEKHLENGLKSMLKT